MYRDLNDYEILYMVSEDFDINFDILYEKYRPLIYKTINNYQEKFKKYGYDIEDLMQIGYITLYKCARLYNDYNQTMFYTYFYKSLIFTLQAEIRTNETNKKEILNNALSYDRNINNGEIEFLDLLPDNSECYNKEYQELVINFKNSMPYDMSCVFELYYNGFSFKEIGKILDKDMNIIKNYFKRIKRHALTYKYLFFS